MKLVIKSGESIDNALKYLQDFLEPYKDDFPLLKGNMNIYITLEGFGHKVCPENEKEYILSDQHPVDVEMSNILAKKEKALEGWERFIPYEYKKVQNLSISIEKEIQYLKTAESKGRKPETIERHKCQLESYKNELKQEEEKIGLIQKLDLMITEGKYKWLFTKRTSSKSLYSYVITAQIIFENINGESWYFEGYENRFGIPFGSLHPGLPDGYQP